MSQCRDWSEADIEVLKKRPQLAWTEISKILHRDVRSLQTKYQELIMAGEIPRDRDRYYSSRQAAMYLGVSTWTLNHYVQVGKIPAGEIKPWGRVASRTRYHLKSDIEKFLEKRGPVRGQGVVK